MNDSTKILVSNKIIEWYTTPEYVVFEFQSLFTTFYRKVKYRELQEILKKLILCKSNSSARNFNIEVLRYIIQTEIV